MSTRRARPPIKPEAHLVGGLLPVGGGTALTAGQAVSSLAAGRLDASGRLVRMGPDGLPIQPAPMVDTPDGKRRAYHTFIANVAGENRKGDWIEQDWDLSEFYAADSTRPPGLWMHDHMRDPHARLEVWIDLPGTEHAALMCRFHYDLEQAFARERSRLYEAELLDAVSIYASFDEVVYRDQLPPDHPAFRPLGDNEWWPGLYRSGGHLREISQVTVPGEAHAVRQSLLAALSAEDHLPARQNAGEQPPPAAVPPPHDDGDAMRSVLLAALLLPTDSDLTDEALAEKAQGAIRERDALAQAARSALQLADDAALPEDLGAALSAATSKAGYLPLAEVALQLADARKAAGDDPRKKAREAVQLAIKERRLPPAAEKAWLAQAEAAPAACVEALASLPATIPIKLQGGGGELPAPSDDVSLSDEEREVCKQLGLSEADFLAEKRARKGGDGTNPSGQEG